MEGRSCWQLVLGEISKMQLRSQLPAVITHSLTVCMTTLSMGCRHLICHHHKQPVFRFSVGQEHAYQFRLVQSERIRCWYVRQEYRSSFVNLYAIHQAGTHLILYHHHYLIPLYSFQSPENIVSAIPQRQGHSIVRGRSYFPRLIESSTIIFNATTFFIFRKHRAPRFQLKVRKHGYYLVISNEAMNDDYIVKLVIFFNLLTQQIRKRGHQPRREQKVLLFVRNCDRSMLQDSCCERQRKTSLHTAIQLEYKTRTFAKLLSKLWMV